MKQRWLLLEPGTQSEQKVVLDKSVLRIGRGADADIRIDNPNVSSLHLSVIISASGADIIDLDSTNGTRLNGRRVKKARLTNGDRLALGGCEIVYREREAPTTVRGKRQQTALMPAYTAAGEEQIRRFTDLLVDKGEIGRGEAGEFLDGWKALWRGNRVLDSIHDVLSKVLSLHRREDLLAELLREMRVLMEMEVIGIYLCRDETFYVMRDDELMTEQHPEMMSDTVLKQVLTKREPVVVEQLGPDSGVVGFKSLIAFKVQSLLCFPVAGRDPEPLGAIYCVSRQIGKIGNLEKDRIFLNACSFIAALSLENLSLIARQTRQARQEERSEQEMRFNPVIRRLRQENENLSLRFAGPQPLQIFGLDLPANAALAAGIEKATRTSLPVLLTGETGTGKNVVAWAIHSRAGTAGAFVNIDCTTIPAELLESELFGHERGAFTGAHVKKTGKVAMASGGTLFLDEISELPPHLQAKLLRLIQSGEYEPVGASKTMRTDARLIFATNRDLKEAIANRSFREDLYFRLNVLNLHLEPLRDKPELIIPLAEYFLSKNAPRLNQSVKAIGEEAQRLLLAHRWPGNIRELENTVLRSIVNCRGETIEANDLELSSFTIAGPAPPPAEDELDLKQARENLDRAYIARALVLAGHNLSGAARLLKINRNSLMDLVKKYELER